MERQKLAERLKEIGFSCTRCGSCCTGGEKDANLVMVMPEEIDLLSKGTGMEAFRFTEPYPESIRTCNGGTITFERCLTRTISGCTFLSGNVCEAYPYRPWICRTYPFMLQGEELMVYPCKGLGTEISEAQADELARLLLLRRSAEMREEEAVKKVLSSGLVPEGEHVLVDGHGISVI
jgi:Fe-S-cluster containining protein